MLDQAADSCRLMVVTTAYRCVADLPLPTGLGSHDFTMPVSNWANGLYYVVLYTEQNGHTRRTSTVLVINR
jgi:hypothetical protein